MVKPKWLIHKFKFPITYIPKINTPVFALTGQTLGIAKMFMRDI